jgi:CheY-like chemotaxis protein
MTFQTNKSNQILIIEDDAEIREALKEILLFEGYSVESVKNGQEGIDYLRHSSPPFLILLDLMMPVMNGYQFLTHYQEDETLFKAPVIVLSADNTNPKKISSLPIKEFLKKPIELDHLLESVKQFWK